MLADRKEIAEKLNNLKEYIPGEPPQLYEFGKFLAERLGSGKILPVGFNLFLELAMHDMEKGVNGYTGKTILPSLTGYPSIYYTVLRLRFDDIARAVLPKKFYQEFKEVRKQIKKQTSNKQKFRSAEILYKSTQNQIDFCL